MLTLRASWKIAKNNSHNNYTGSSKNSSAGIPAQRHIFKKRGLFSPLRVLVSKGGEKTKPQTDEPSVHHFASMHVQKWCMELCIVDPHSGRSSSMWKQICVPKSPDPLLGAGLCIQAKCENALNWVHQFILVMPFVKASHSCLQLYYDVADFTLYISRL